jgi:hypothetical protein
MKPDDLACPSCGGQDIEIAVFEEPPYFIGMECVCGWTCEGEGIDWRAQLVPYEGGSTEEDGEEWPQEGWPLDSEAPGPGEPPGW